MNFIRFLFINIFLVTLALSILALYILLNDPTSYSSSTTQEPTNAQIAQQLLSILSFKVARDTKSPALLTNIEDTEKPVPRSYTNLLAYGELTLLNQLFFGKFT